MFIITEKDNKTFIYKKPITLFKRIIRILFILLFTFFVIYNILSEGIYIVGIALFLLVALYLILIVIAHRKSNKTLTSFMIDWKKKVIHYEFGEVELGDIPLTGITINCIMDMHLSSKGNRTYYLRFSLSDESGNFFPLWQKEYHDAIILVNYFYQLYQKGLIKLNHAGQFLSKNHAKRSLDWVYIV
jgi:Ca2+/Na+ antiporter